MNEQNIQQHQEHYSEDKLWNKVRRVAKKAGASAIYAVLLLYYTLQNLKYRKGKGDHSWCIRLFHTTS